ncbi:MAG: hypothetical protein ACYC27_11430 [Armatimonadota bacterium]
MTYSYGKRRFTIGKPINAIWMYMLINILFIIRNMLGDRVEQISDRYLHLPTNAIMWIIILILYIIIRINLFCKLRKNRPDLPSTIEISDSGTLRLFHGQAMYAEIPINQITALNDVMLDVLPPFTVNASELMLETPVQGANHIYILPFLAGYSDFILKLLDISPDLRSMYKKTEWESLPYRDSWPLICYSIIVLMFFFILFYIAFDVQQMHGHINMVSLWIFWSMVTAIIVSIIVAIFFVVREACERASMISFYTDKMQIARSSFWYSHVHNDVYPRDITGIDIIPSGKKPEQCIIRTETRRFCIPSAYMKNYPLLVQRIREFREQVPALDA